jgi:PAS domain S-box-containing protein
MWSDDTAAVSPSSEQGHDMRMLLASTARDLCGIDGVDAVRFVLHDREVNTRVTILYPDTAVVFPDAPDDDHGDRMVLTDPAGGALPGRQMVRVPLRYDGNGLGYVAVLGQASALDRSFVAAMERLADRIARAALAHSLSSDMRLASHRVLIRHLEQKIAQSHGFVEAVTAVTREMTTLLMADLGLLIGVGSDDALFHLAASRDLDAEQRGDWAILAHHCLSELRAAHDPLVITDLTGTTLQLPLCGDPDAPHAARSLLSIPIMFDSVGLQAFWLFTSSFSDAFSDREATILRSVLAQVQSLLDRALAAHQHAASLDIQESLVNVTRVFLHFAGYGSRDEVMGHVADALVRDSDCITGAALHLPDGEGIETVARSGDLATPLAAEVSANWDGAIADVMAQRKECVLICAGLSCDGLLLIARLEGDAAEDGAMTGAVSLLVDPLGGLLATLAEAWQPLLRVLGSLMRVAALGQERPLPVKPGAIRMGREAIRLLFDGFPAGMFMVDQRGQVVATNALLYQMLGGKPEGAVGDDNMPPSLRHILSSAQLQQSLEWGTVARQAEQIVVDGEVRLLEITTFPIYGDDLSQAQAAVGIIENLSAEHRLAETLSRSEKYTAVGRLTSGLAHDLNNRLSTVLLNAELLLGEVDPASPHYESAELIHRSAEWLAQAVRGLQRLARDHTFELAQTDVNRTIERSLALLRPYLRRSDIEVECYLAPDLPHIEASYPHLEQVWSTLIINGMDTRIADGVSDVMEISSRCDAGEWVVVTVRSSGMVIPGAADAAADTARQVMGVETGLGLHGCLQIIQQHGGSVGIAYDERGTCFDIRLPVVQAASQRDDVAGS